MFYVFSVFSAEKLSIKTKKQEVVKNQKKKYIWKDVLNFMSCG